jgi:hypothetical protein
MKSSLLIIIILVALLAGCKNSPGKNNEIINEADTVTVPDTGYTGIKQFMSGHYLISEVTFKNGVMEGLKKTFYQSGRLQRTFWYVNGLRQDSSCWYYEEGQIFRTTPYRNDTIDGIQKQYYRTGELKAEMGYSNGYRTDFFREFTRDGRLVSGYPELVIKTEDKYRVNGTYRVRLELTDKKTNVKFFRGDFYDGAYDTTKVKKIRTVDNTGYIDLKKTGSPKQSYVGVIAEILTNFGNRLLVYKKVELPYNDME